MKTVSLCLALLSSAVFAQGMNPGGGSSTSQITAVLTSATETTAALTLYVDSTGSDSNACTASGTGACLTVQGALGKIPKRIRHPVTVTVGAGNFAGWVFPEFVFDMSGGTSAYLDVVGTYANVTPATGSATGTATSGAAGSATSQGTLTDSAATWTVNDLRDKLVVATTAGVVTFRPIVSNTATALTVAGTWTAPTASTTYAIVENTSVINTAKTPAVGVSALTGAAALVTLGGCQGMANTNALGIRNFKFTTTSAVGFHNLSSGCHVRVWRNQFLPVSGATVQLAYVNGSRMTIVDNVFANVTGGTAVGRSSTFLGNDSAYVQMNTNSIRGGALGLGCLGQCVFTGYYEGQTTAAVYAYRMSRLTGSTGTWIDCLSHASAKGISTDEGSIDQGPAPLTIFASSGVINNCFVAVAGQNKGVTLDFISLTGSGNTTAFKLLRGASLQIWSGVTIAGTTEVDVDGSTTTLAAIRALVPKAFPASPNAYGTVVFE